MERVPNDESSDHSEHSEEAQEQVDEGDQRMTILALREQLERLPWVRAVGFDGTHMTIIITPENRRHTGSFRQRVAPYPGVNSFTVDLGHDPVGANRHRGDLMARARGALRTLGLLPIHFRLQVAGDGRLLIGLTSQAREKIDFN